MYVLFDGIKLFSRIDNVEDWKQSTNVDLFTPIDNATGLIKSKLRNRNGVMFQSVTHTGSFETYKIKVKENIPISNLTSPTPSYQNNNITIVGSLHKNHYGGENHLPFSYDGLVSQVNKLSEKLKIHPHETDLQNIEIGVNIPFNKSPIEFLTNHLLMYKGKPFERYVPDRNGVSIGYVCYGTQYDVKVYDKGLQYGLPNFLMRFELRFKKMQLLNTRFGIYTLFDLLNNNNYEALTELLRVGWDNVMLRDETPLKSKLKAKERQLIIDGSNVFFWQQLQKKDVRQFNYLRNKYKSICADKGNNYHTKLKSKLNILIIEYL